MTPEQVQVLIDAALKGAAQLNAFQPTTLIAFGAFMALITVIISLSLVFVVIRLLGVQTLFINNMTGRSIMANEQIRASTDTQTQAIAGNSNAMMAMNQTGLKTGAAVDRVEVKQDALGVKFVEFLELAGELGFDVQTLAKHAVAPTASTQEKVEKIAEKPDSAPDAGTHTAAALNP